MTKRTMMRVRLAVADYQRMFPEEYQGLVLEVQRQKDNMKNDFASLDEGQMIKRGLFTVSEKLASMIGLKLDEKEQAAFKEKENARWFAKEFPQFALTKEI